VPLVPRRLDDLPAPAGLDADALVPPPRFGTVGFDTYRPVHPSQAAARAAVEGAVASLAVPARRRWPWQEERAGRGLYLDGGFGVGKTHLLAAAFHAAPTPSKRYLSFQELVYLIGMWGIPEAARRLGSDRLYCLDEFELDDPGTTLIVKTFLGHVFARGALVVTTSNTPPEAQGAGRFNAEDFRREIQSIARHFEVVRVEGPDGRAERGTGELLAAEELPAPRDDLVHASWEELVRHLARHHPARYRAQLEALAGLVVVGVRTLTDQNDALRFVHFVDKAYDLCVPVWLAGDVALSDVFDASYAGGAFEKKYHRTTSRLAEMLAEARALGGRPLAAG
jgi:cell division protein ZapE